jgi:ribonuclease HII
MSKSLTSEKEHLLLDQGYEYIIGIDEVGRGAWAGPAAVGGFAYKIGDEVIEGVNDSKQVSIKLRESLYPQLKMFKHLIKFGELELIDSIGIGKTIETLVVQIVEEFNNEFDGKVFFIVDGQFSFNFGTNSIKENKADENYYSVAAASILAKVERDRLMRQFHIQYPEYGFETNVGYPSSLHRKVLNELGPTLIHRKSFRPIKSYFI